MIRDVRIRLFNSDAKYKEQGIQKILEADSKESKQCIQSFTEEEAKETEEPFQRYFQGLMILGQNFSVYLK